jgi:hypothetical protein
MNESESCAAVTCQTRLSVKVTVGHGPHRLFTALTIASTWINDRSDAKCLRDLPQQTPPHEAAPSSSDPPHAQAHAKSTGTVSHQRLFSQTPSTLGLLSAMMPPPRSTLVSPPLPTPYSRDGLVPPSDWSKGWDIVKRPNPLYR